MTASILPCMCLYVCVYV